MLKPLAAALIASLAAATAAAAADTPKTPEECLASALTVAEAAENKELSEEKLTKVEEQLAALEWHCEASRFAEAATVLKDIEATLGN